MSRVARKVNARHRLISVDSGLLSVENVSFADSGTIGTLIASIVKCELNRGETKNIDWSQACLIRMPFINEAKR